MAMMAWYNTPGRARTWQDALPASACACACRVPVPVGAGGERPGPKISRPALLLGL